MPNGNPQLEDGFTPIADELLEAMCRNTMFNVNTRVYFALIRLIYGWGKTSDKIARSQITDLTNIKVNNVTRALQELKKMNMIGVSDLIPGVPRTYTIIKTYGDWRPVSKVRPHSNLRKGSIKANTGGSIKADTHHKEFIDNTIKSSSKKVIKKIKHLDCVLLTPDEHQKLVATFGAQLTKDKIQNLNDYCMSKGTKYKSHYHTILSWSRKDNKTVVGVDIPEVEGRARQKLN